MSLVSETLANNKDGKTMKSKTRLATVKALATTALILARMGVQ